MASNQAYLFLIFTLNGILIGLLFDIFRIIRKSFKTNDIATYIEDILFWVLTGFIVLYSMYKFCDGELRGFTIIGIAIGVIIYMTTVSTYIIKIFVYIISKLKNILYIIIKAILSPFKIVFKPVSIICINIRKAILLSANNVYKKIKNVKKQKISKNFR